MNVNPMKETPMRMRYALLALTLALFTARCSDESGALPTSLDTSAAIDISADMLALEVEASHTLRQAADAPALETYQLSFWVRRDRGARVQVDYLPRRGKRDGDRFLKFEVPDRSVVSWPGYDPRNRRDSVEITLTIDTVLLSVHFEPAGLKFKSGNPAKLTFWYGNTDPDLNGDGAVNAADSELAAQIAIWNAEKKQKGKRMKSENDWTGRSVTGRVPHFSQYAASW